MSKIRNVLSCIFLFLLTALILNLANPLFDKPSRDGGFFLYAGQQILNGKIPYLDFWDNKGPAIFYINALGLWLGSGSRWGVWSLEFLCIFGTLLILYRALSKRLGFGAALFGVMMAGLGLRVALGYGNYTEEYALLFNAVGLSLFLSMGDSEKGYLKYFWIGTLFGLSFTFRANNIGGLFGILVAVALFNVYKRNVTEVLKIILVTLAGFAVPLVLWVAYFAFLGGVKEMIYGSITFNFSYSAAKDRSWLDLFSGFGRYGMSWYGGFALLAWVILSLRELSNLVQKKSKPSVLAVFLLIWFPIEILLSNLSGRSFTHYYISWTLSVAVYSAVVFGELWQVIFKVSSLQGWNERLGTFASAALIVLLFIISPSTGMRYGETISRLFNRAGALEYIDPISAYIIKNTQPNDFVLTWYPERGINFVTGRTSPVKYTNYPLFIDNSLTEEIESTYISGLTTNRPELILDCSRSVDAIPSLDLATRKVQYSTPGVKRKMYIQPGMDQIFSFVSANYHKETSVDNCLIFRLNKE